MSIWNKPITQWTSTNLAIYLEREGVPVKGITFLVQQDIDGKVVITTPMTIMKRELLNLLTFGIRQHILVAFKKLKAKQKELNTEYKNNIPKYRAYKKWSTQEETMLINNYHRTDMNIKSIAHKHRRSEKAIRCRLWKLRQRHQRNESLNNNVIIENNIDGDGNGNGNGNDENNETDNDIDLIDADFSA